MIRRLIRDRRSDDRRSRAYRSALPNLGVLRSSAAPRRALALGPRSRGARQLAAEAGCLGGAVLGRYITLRLRALRGVRPGLALVVDVDRRQCGGLDTPSTVARCRSRMTV